MGEHAHPGDGAIPHGHRHPHRAAVAAPRATQHHEAILAQQDIAVAGRRKRGGMHWGVERGANPILTLRCWWLGGRHDEFFKACTKPPPTALAARASGGANKYVVHPTGTGVRHICSEANHARSPPRKAQVVATRGSGPTNAPDTHPAVPKKGAGAQPRRKPAPLGLPRLPRIKMSHTS